MNTRRQCARWTWRAITCLGILMAAGGAVAQPWEQAAQNGEQNRRGLLYCWRFVQGWLQTADPATGLIPRNLRADGRFWNARDAAADNYPFMVLSSFFTDKNLFEGPMRQMLETEQRLCNRLDRLPDDWDFATQAFRTPEYDLDALIFGASEYAKDGLTPVTELLGPTDWSERMRGLIDDIWKHAAIETEAGILPATSHEVCGELMQVMSRLYWMTGDETYREETFRIAQYFLDYHNPADAEHLRLDDHGCEVIGGLSEAYYLAAKTDPPRHERWRPAMHRILDRILEVGRNEQGLLYNTVNAQTGEKTSDELTDNWGYNYNAFLVVAEIDGEPRFREAVEHVLTHLPDAKDYPWEGDIADGIADSLEGGLNLLNRLRVAPAIEWADYMAERLHGKQQDTGIIAGWHGDGNAARTMLMYVLWKSQGAWVEPWRADVRVGAAVEEGVTYFTVESDWPYSGTLRFDVPRHREYLGIPDDYPRLNQFPEWFTVAAEASFQSGGATYAAADLRAGLAVECAPDSPFRLELAPAE